MKKKTNPNGNRYLFIPEHITENDIKHALGVAITSKAFKDVQIFLHRIVIKAIFLSSKKDYEFSGYVQLNKEERRYILGRNYVHFQNLLIKAGIIEVETLDRLINSETGEVETVEAYAKGHSSKKYRIRGYTTYKRVDITKDYYIISRLDMINHYRKDDLEIYRTLKENVDRLKLKDTPELRSSLTNYFQDKGDVFNSKRPLSGEEYILLFNSLEMPTTVDDFGKRFHAKHTRLKKSFRENFEFEGHEGTSLANVDIRNSQPLLISLISANLIKVLAPECSEAIPIFLKYQENKDYKKFKRLCQSAKIYEFLIEGFWKYFKIEISRDLAKKAFYYACYSYFPKHPEELQKKVLEMMEQGKGIYDLDGLNKRRMKKYSLFLVQKLFPSLFQINLELKKLNWRHLANKHGKYYKKHANSPLLAQRIESALLIKYCAANMIEDGIITVTIHDSFIVLEKDTGKVKKIIASNFNRLGLIKPKLKVEKLIKQTVTNFKAAA